MLEEAVAAGDAVSELRTVPHGRLAGPRCRSCLPYAKDLGRSRSLTVYGCPIVRTRVCEGWSVLSKAVGQSLSGGELGGGSSLPPGGVGAARRNLIFFRMQPVRSS